MYTSNSEFEFEKHVQLTNEIPPYDMYKGLNRVLKNDLWKWFLGYSSVEYEKSYSEGYEKYVNGVKSQVYGPKPRPTDPNPTYHSMSVNGGLLPEMDLFLHEAYRYLSTLYPDHPDWRYLLTTTEINDAISEAAAIVDYKPDNEFFDYIAQYLDKTLTSDEVDAEGLKLKIRNLKNNSFRRKLYGASLGYRMFCGDALMSCSVFPVGTYITLEPIGIDSEESDVEKQIIDFYNSNYNKKFKLIDWTNELRKLQTEFVSEKESEYVNLIEAPLYPDTERFEVPSCLDAESKVYDIKIGSPIGKFFIAGVKESSNIEEVSFHNEGSSIAIDVTESVKKSHSIDISTTDKNHYESFYAFDVGTFDIADDDPLQDTIQNLDAYPTLLEKYFQLYKNMVDLDDLKFFKKTISVAVNPFVDGTLIVSEPELVKLYPTNEDDEFSSKNIGLNPGELLIKDPSINLTKNKIFSVVEANKGKIFITVDDESNVAFQKINENEKFLLSLGTGKKSPYFGDDTYIDEKVCVVGHFKNPAISIKSDGSRYYKNLQFVIDYIPEDVTDYAKYVYPIYRQALSRRESLLESLPDLLTISNGFISQLRTVSGEIINAVTREITPGNDGIIPVVEELCKTNRERILYNERIDIRIGASVNLTNINKIDYVYNSYELTEGNFGSLSVIPFIVDRSISTIPNLILDSVSDYENLPSRFSLSHKISSLRNQTLEYLNVEPFIDPLKEYSFSYIPDDYIYCFIDYKKDSSYEIKIKQTTTLEILGECNVQSPHIVTVSDPTSLELIKSISVGDSFYGPFVDDNTYVLNTTENTIEINNPVIKDGQFVFYIEASGIANIFAKDYHNKFIDYKKEDAYTNIFDTVIFPSYDPSGENENLKWPNTSQGYLTGLPPHKFNVYNSSHSFETLMKSIYADYIDYNGTEPKNKVFPAVVKFNNDVFVEVNLNRLYDNETKNGDTPTLITYKQLDYVENALDELQKASDNVNVGAQLLMNGDSSGVVTPFDNDYTDPSIKLKFRTWNFKSSTIPVYAAIGGDSKTLDYVFAKKNAICSIVWGGAFWDGFVDDFYEKYNNSDKFDFSARSVWSDSESYTELSRVTYLKNVADPIFEINLGEYDVQLDYIPTGTNSKFTTVQANFVKSELNNLNFDIDNVKFIDDEFFSTNICKSLEENYIDENVVKPSYKGTFNIKTKAVYVGNETFNAIVYPEEASIGDYYVIANNATISMIDPNDINYGSNLDKFKEPDVEIATVHINDQVTITCETKINPNDAVVFIDDEYEKEYYFEEFSNNEYTFMSLPIIAEIGRDLQVKIIRKKYYEEYTDNITVKKNSLLIYEEDGWHIKDFVYSGVFGANQSSIALSGSPAMYNGHKWNWEISDTLNGDYREEGDESIGVGKFPALLLYKLAYTYGLMNSKVIGLYNEFTEGDFLNGSIIEGKNAICNNFNFDNTYYFTYSGYAGYRLISSNVELTPGDFICVSFVKDTHKEVCHLSDKKRNYEGTLTEVTVPYKVMIYFIKANNEIALSLNFSRPNSVTDTEWLQAISDTTSYGLAYVKNNVSNYVKLPLGSIAKNSEDLTIYAVPKLYGNTYKYADNKVDTRTTYNMPISEESIKYDKDNGVFYEEINGEKYALIFNENKFFKNKKVLCGVYQSLDLQNDSGEYDLFGTLRQLDNVDFDIEGLTSDDIILKVDEIKLRSSYNQKLEPTVLCAYSNIEGAIYGVNENKTVISAKSESQADRVSIASQIYKVYPKVEDGAADTGIAELNGKNLRIYNSDKFKNRNATEYVSYYKNALVIEGTIDRGFENRVLFDNENPIMENLSLMSVGNSVLDIYSIDGYSSDPVFITTGGTQAEHIKDNIFATIDNNVLKIISVGSPDAIELASQDNVSKVYSVQKWIKDDIYVVCTDAGLFYVNTNDYTEMYKIGFSSTSEVPSPSDDLYEADAFFCDGTHLVVTFGNKITLGEKVDGEWTFVFDKIETLNYDKTAEDAENKTDFIDKFYSAFWDLLTFTESLGTDTAAYKAAHFIGEVLYNTNTFTEATARWVTTGSSKVSEISKWKRLDLDPVERKLIISSANIPDADRKTNIENFTIKHFLALVYSYMFIEASNHILYDSPVKFIESSHDKLIFVTEGGNAFYKDLAGTDAIFDEVEGIRKYLYIDSYESEYEVSRCIYDGTPISDYTLRIIPFVTGNVIKNNEKIIICGKINGGQHDEAYNTQLRELLSLSESSDNVEDAYSSFIAINENSASFYVSNGLPIEYVQCNDDDTYVTSLSPDGSYYSGAANTDDPEKIGNDQNANSSTPPAMKVSYADGQLIACRDASYTQFYMIGKMSANSGLAIKDVGLNYIQLSGAAFANMTSPKCRVLLSIKTNGLVDKSYLKTSGFDDYFDESGNLMVMANYEVTNPSDAQFMYIRNELSEDEDITSYPSIHYDKTDEYNKFKYYSYQFPDGFDASDPAQVDALNPIELKNINEQNVYLCDASVKPICNGSPISLKDYYMLTDTEALRKAPKVALSKIAFLADTYKDSNCVSHIDGALVTKLSQYTETSMPYVEINCGDDVCEKWTYTNTEDDEFINYISLFLPITDEQIAERFIEKDGFWYDTLLDVYPVKKDYYASFGVTFDYDCNISETPITFTSLDIDDDVVAPHNESLPITHVYFNPRGYGGSRFASGLNDMPWNVDKEAFTDKIAKNIAGNYIKVLDIDGTEYNGICGNCISDGNVKTFTFNKKDFVDYKHVVSYTDQDGDKIEVTLFAEHDVKYRLYSAYKYITNEIDCHVGLLKISNGYRIVDYGEDSPEVVITGGVHLDENGYIIKDSYTSNDVTIKLKINGEFIDFYYDNALVSEVVLPIKDISVDNFAIGEGEESYNKYTLKEKFDDVYCIKSSNSDKNVIKPIGENNECIGCVHTIYYNKETFTLTVDAKKDTLISGVYGTAYMMVPAYHSFEELINDKGTTIISNTLWDNFDKTYSFGKIKAANVSDDQISNLIFDGVLNRNSLNDRKEHFLRFELFTKKTVNVPYDKLGDTSLYCSYDSDLVNEFLPDRVFFVNGGYPASPYNLFGRHYRGENDKYYSFDEYWANGSSFVYECDENGIPLQRNDNGTSTPIGDEYSVDLLAKMLKPNYVRCFDWFRNEYYIDGSELNPFIQIFKYKNTYKNGDIVGSIDYNELKKINGEIAQSKIDESETYSKLVTTNLNAVVDEVITKSSAIIDYYDGKLTILAKNSIKPAQEFIKYGIWCAADSTSDNLKFKIKMSYASNTNENFLNKFDKDSEITSCKEFGLFDANHNMVGYATFPAIEYRSKSQHISIVAVISHSNHYIEEEQ